VSRDHRLILLYSILVIVATVVVLSYVLGAIYLTGGLLHNS
jgi:hypothetical protein